MTILSDFSSPVSQSPTSRFCVDCKKHCTIDAFDPDRQTIDGLSHHCRPCTEAAACRQKNARVIWELNIRKNYGLTPEQYYAMLNAQGGVCAICGGPPNHKKGYHIDHDHTTGKVRGILCHGCNAALGGAKDNPATLRAAADYLERHGK